ncbi:dipeptidyl peptidase 2-like [Rhopilema esculentum]|uniref:dipeptidyl peptidase 2-like n=1 Tax=Rhopilema esculentum TaxID=499914 RepID=UPI0031DF8FC9|eukprot:gene17011-8516_t
MELTKCICIIFLYALAANASVLRPKSSQVDQAILPYEEKYFVQYIDHFNYLGPSPGSNRTYSQRFLIQGKYWVNKKGPVFFYTGNEGPIDGFWKASGFVHELAAKYQALIIFAEHRYYGSSLPFGQDSFKKENIGFLNMEQALADYAVLLKSLSSLYKFDGSKIVSFGGSYGGMLSGYMRYKYPHIVDIAVASSAPFYTIAGNRPRSEFFQAVTNVCRNADENCPGNVQAAFSILLDLFKKEKTGIQEIKDTFKLCSAENTPQFVKLVIGWLRNAFTLMAMGDYPYPATFLAPLPAFPINVACNYMAQNADKLKALAEVAFLLYGKEKECHNVYDEFVDCADPTGCGLGNDAIAWDYQACTEMILPGGSTNVTDMFPAMPFTLEDREAYCSQKYLLGKSRLSWVSTNFWGTADDIKHASKIIFPNGDLDPWMPGGVLEDLSPDLRAVLVKGGAHHLDLRGSNPADPETVKLARKQIESYINQWL